jgi:hypothetical protein
MLLPDIPELLTQISLQYYLLHVKLTDSNHECDGSRHQSAFEGATDSSHNEHLARNTKYLGIE